MNDFVPTKKKDFFYIIVLLLTFIVVIVGATFAIFTYLKSQNEGSSAVYTGSLSIEYSRGRIVNINKLFPISNTDYDSVDNVYRNEFKVSNTGTLDSLIDVVLDLTLNDFSNNTLMYDLYNSNKVLVSSGYIYGRGKITLLSNYTINHEETENFVLMIYIKENDEDQNSEMRKSLNGMIEIVGNQKLE